MLHFVRSREADLTRKPAFIVKIWLVYIHCHGSFPKVKGIATSINIDIAATNASHYTWTDDLTIPNIYVIPHISYSSGVLCHPLVNKLYETMVYFSYLIDFYDGFPDISTHIHAEEATWHNEVILKKSISYIINNLDPNEAKRQKYVMLIYEAF